MQYCDMDKLTDKQKEVLGFIRAYIAQNGYSPSLSGISEAFGWASVNAAHTHVLALARKGKLRKTPRGWMPV